MKLHITEQGEGQVSQSMERIELRVPSSTKEQYSNAQIASYQTRSDFVFRPPLRLSLTAWVEGHLHGTAGFGFWNHPFAPGSKGIHLPKSLWFFHATTPNNMALALDVPGWGWKCATLDATRWQFLAMLPTAPIGLILMRSHWLYRRLWPVGQRALGVSEHLLDRTLLMSPHQYMIEWYPDQATFYVDGVPQFFTNRVPAGPLGFIAWVDTQYAVVTPQGYFRFGLLDTTELQMMFIQDLRMETLKSGAEHQVK